MAQKIPKKRIEDLNASEAEKLMESGEKVKLAAPPKRDNLTLFTLRLDFETVDELARIALEESSKPSTIARQLIHEALERRSYNEGLIPDFSSDIEFILSRYRNSYYRQLNAASSVTHVESPVANYTVQITVTGIHKEVK